MDMLSLTKVTLLFRSQTLIERGKFEFWFSYTQFFIHFSELTTGFEIKK